MLTGDNGLLKKTINSKQSAEIAQDIEQLQIYGVKASGKNKYGDLKIDEYLDYLEEEEIPTTKKDGHYYVSINGKIYQVEVENDNITATYVEDGEITAPRIKSIEVTGEKSANNLTINVTGYRMENGTYTYYIGTSEDNFTLVGTQTTENGDDTYTFSGLEVDTLYYIKVVGTTQEGETSKIITTKIETEDNTKPDLSVEVVDTTSNSIEIKASATDNESGIEGQSYSYYISETESGLSGSAIASNTTGEYTFTGLKQDTTYYIKVTIKDVAGNETSVTKTQTTGTVTALTNSNTDFTATPSYWTNGSVTVTATTETGYTLQTSKDNSTYTATATQTFTANGTMYVRLTDGTNVGSYTTYTVSNIDTAVPTISTALSSSSITSSGFTLNIGVTDTLSGFSKVVWYYKLSSASSYTSVTDEDTKVNGSTAGTTTAVTKTKTLTGLTSGTYNAYAVVYDVAGNSTTSETINITLKAVTALTDANITFTATPSTWTNGSVTVTAKITTETGYTLQTSKDNSTYTSTATQTFTENGTMYVRLTDGINVGEYATYNVENIDTTKPTIGSVTGSTGIGNTGTVTVSSISDTGGSGLKGIYISTSSTTPTATSVTWTSNTSSSYSKTVSANGTYYVWVIDNAGNISEVKSCTVSNVYEKVVISSYADATVVAGNSIAHTLSLTGTPDSLTFSSSNTSVATIDSSSGQVKGVAAGTATMTVIITNFDGTTVTATCTITVQTAVAQIGTTYYSSLANAVSAVTSSTATTIELLTDTTESVTVPNGRDITINLNSHTYQSSGTALINQGTLVIMGDGTISSSSYVINNSSTSATLKLNNVTVSHTGTSTNAVVNKGTLTIMNGTTVSSASSSAMVYNYGTINMKKGTVKSTGGNSVTNLPGATINVSAGTITSTKLYGINNTGGTVNVSGGTVNSTGGSGICCTSGAINVSGGTVKSSSYCGIWNKGGTVTVTGGTLTNSASTGGGLLNESGTATISGGTVTSTTNYSLANSGTVTITGGTVESTVNMNNIINYEAGSMTIGGDSSITSTSGTSANVFNSGTLYVEGGTITAAANAISNQSTGNLIVSGGTITSTGTTQGYNYGIYNEGGTVTINGGTISSKNF